MELIDEYVSLRDKNTYRIGGRARYFAVPGKSQEIIALIQWANDKNIPLFFLGKGSNVLISDYDWPGLVIYTGAGLFDNQIQWENRSVIAPGGVPLNLLIKSVADKGYVGMAELAGIPGTVGGAVVMNAGAYSESICGTLHDVTCCRRENGEVFIVSADELQLGYRYSILKNTGDIVLSARFTFTHSETPEELHTVRHSVLEKRKLKQPLEYPNCGSVFKRPVGYYAGELIEKCGLKGLRVGDAQVSEKHANFIINTAHAKAEEVRELIMMVQKRVFEQVGILLEPEVIFVGDFNQTLYSG